MNGQGKPGRSICVNPGKRYGRMARTFQNKDEVNRWHDQYGPLAPRAGDAAPDFELQDARAERSVQLSDFRDDRPVALVFGSFT